VTYSDVPELDAAYALIARLYEPGRPSDARPDEAMVIAAALLELGERRSWASVWWAYGALHHELSDEALARADELLGDVEGPDEARAAALMLRAEIRFTQAVYAGSRPAPDEQRRLLEQAVALGAGWPSLHIRLARACRDARDNRAAAEHAARALELRRPTDDPFDSAISGHNLDRDYLEREAEQLRAGGR
jgi:hypothetical protein